MDRGRRAFLKTTSVAAVTVATALAMSSPTFAQVTAPPTSGLKLVPGRAVEWKSLKEKLSDKASDEQRVDNCRVPLERSGSKPRPGCPGEAESPVPATGDKMDGSTSN
jgi:hypothetical protein